MAPPRSILLCFLSFLPQTFAESDTVANPARLSFPWTPANPGWQARMERRLKQIRQIENTQWRWDAYIGLLTTGVVVQNFTEMGFEVVDGPKELFEELRDAVHRGIPTAGSEGPVDQIFCDESPKFVHTGLNGKVLRELHPLHEEWAGVPLEAAISYGMRIYKNGSFLTMHTDRLDTHVISSIFHIDRDQNEPWPLVIEDTQGRVHEVALEPGQLLFYESSKLLHGRPRRFNGKWYTSIFTHYYPKGWTKSTQEVMRTIPPSWNDAPEDNGEPRLTVVGTGLLEHCASHWCDLEEGENWQEVDEEWLNTKLRDQLGIAAQTRDHKKSIIKGQSPDDL